MHSPSNETSQWIEQVKLGDSEAQRQLWDRYFGRLVAAVRGRLRKGRPTLSDEEDIALSVLDSFYDAAQRGRFPSLVDRDDLWHLLLRMASHKVIDQKRRSGRRRRGGDVGIQSIDAIGKDGRAYIEVVDDEPTAEMVVSLAETLDQLFSVLGVGTLRELAGAKLEGYSNAEMATRFGCSERTIERRLHLIREKFRLSDDTET